LQHEKTPTSLDLEEDDDPVIVFLRYLDYRYIRFCYHPLLDIFMLNNSWKDPNWDDVRSIRSGIGGDEKRHRSLVFGDNVIDIEEKTTMQLLVDEVRLFYLMHSLNNQKRWTHWICTADYSLTKQPGLPSILRISSSQFSFMDNGRLLLLCHLYLYNISYQYHEYSDRNQISESNLSVTQ